MAFLHSIATAEPEYLYKQSTLLEYMLQATPDLAERERRLLKTIYKQSTIEQRYSVLPDFASDSAARLFLPDSDLPNITDRMACYVPAALALASKSARQTLAKSNISPASVTHIITVSCTGLTAPGLEVMLIEELGLSHAIHRQAVNFVGCHASFQALRIARALCTAEPDANILLISVELCTLHFAPGADEETILANSLFADGAAALLVSSKKPERTPALELRSFFSGFLPASTKEMAWELTPSHFKMRLASYLPSLLGAPVRELVQRALDAFKLVQEDIENWAVHPGGKNVLKTVQHTFGLPITAMVASEGVLRDHGNLSSTTILYVLKRTLESLPQKPVLALGFGPGITLESFIAYPV
jgi:alpha-pyrone synthase